jgi:phospholipase C
MRPDAAALDGSLSDAGAGADAGAGSPIRYIFVLVKENHTFDNYFADFPGAEGSLTAELSTGATLARPVAPDGPTSHDISHSHSSALIGWASGRMNGFDLIPPLPNDRTTFIRYTEAEIPNYWKYAREFVLADHFFTTTLGPSFPGHFALWNAQTPALDNPVCLTAGCPATGEVDGCNSNRAATVTTYDPSACTTAVAFPCFDIPSIVDALPAGYGWTDYGWRIQTAVKSVASRPDAESHFKPLSALLPDFTSGQHANLVYAHIEGGAFDEHPPSAVCPGEGYTVQLVNAIMNGPHWQESAIIITWDDWGGYYDHVAPPVNACPNGQAFNLGFRVPTLVISPYARRGYVLKTVTDQASVPRLIEDLWHMPRMADRDPRARDDRAGSLLDAFDFAQPPRAKQLLTPRTCP